MFAGRRPGDVAAGHGAARAGFGRRRSGGDSRWQDRRGRADRRRAAGVGWGRRSDPRCVEEDRPSRVDRVPLAPALFRPPPCGVSASARRRIPRGDRGDWRRYLVNSRCHSQSLRSGAYGGAGLSLQADPRSSGVTTLEVKSGYGLTPEHELHQLELLAASRQLTQLSLVISAPWCPRGSGRGGRYTDTIEVLETLPAVIDQGIAAFHDITCEAGLFTPQQAKTMFEASRQRGIPTKAHADAWANSQGWETAVAGGAVSRRAPYLHPRRADSRRRYNRYDSCASAAGRARVHDRTSGERSAVDRP